MKATMGSYEALQRVRSLNAQHLKDRKVVYLVTDNVSHDVTAFATAYGAMWHAHSLLPTLELKERWEEAEYSLSVFVWDDKNDCCGVSVRVMEVLS